MGGRTQNLPGGSWLSSNTQRVNPRRNRTTPGGRNFAPAVAAWLALDPTDQALWDTAAETLPLYDRYTAPVLTTGQQLFESYNTNLLFYGQGGSFVDVPPDPPTWGTVPSFNGKAVNEEDTLFHICAADIAAGTLLACYGQPPAVGAIRLLRSLMRYCGVLVVPEDWEPDQAVVEVGEQYETVFGSPVQDPLRNNWMMLYQVEGGFLRLVGDPCYTVEAPPTILFIDIGATIGAGDVSSPAGPNFFVEGPDGIEGFTIGPWAVVEDGPRYTTELDIGYDVADVIECECKGVSTIFGPTQVFVPGPGPAKEFTFSGL